MNAVILSYAQDTNGQNARFVEAAKRLGRTPQVLQVIAIGKDDPAGVIGRYQQATARIEGLRIRSAHRITHYFDFPSDIIWDLSTQGEIRELIRRADVVHLNNSHVAMQRFRIRKPMLLHHHGSMFRNNPERMLTIARQFRMTQAVSTIDLLRHAPDGVLHWLPTAYDVRALRTFADGHRRPEDGKVRIVHAPTNRAAKHTEMLVKSVAKLEKELPVELVLIEGKSNAEVLEEKAKADIVFDQLTFGYGCNSVEAWAMGIPVLSGADDWTKGRMTDEFGALPFYDTTEKTLTARLRDLVESPELRAEWAEHGYQHVLRYHDELPALTKLAELYVMAMDQSSRSVPKVRFVNAGRTVWAAGERVDPGPFETTDPEVINRLRTLAHRPIFGIQEVT